MIAALSAACQNDARDAHCNPDGANRTDNPECIYAGTGKGPLFVDEACPALTGDAPAKCPSFYDVLDVIVDPARGNCSSLGCHGAAVGAQTDIYLPVADPVAFYNGLLDAEGSVGEPYVIADDPGTAANESLDSWMHCNLVGAHGGGYPMPPPGGLPNPDDVAVVEDWLRCGAPAPKTCDAAETDTECVTCAKASCCPAVQQCLDDTDCAPCVACVQQNGSVTACTAQCDTANAHVEKLFSCVGAICSTQCPGVQ